MEYKKDNEEQAIYDSQRANFDRKIDYLKSEINDIDNMERDELIEIEAFLSVLGNASQYYKNASYVRKREIAKLFFSNIVLDQQERLHIAVKP